MTCGSFGSILRHNTLSGVAEGESRIHFVALSTVDPYRNLAYEELLLDAQPSAPVFVVYRNAEAVVIGKHQNPWRECPAAVAAWPHDLRALCRRVSGGGTVYHDEGNLNIAYVGPREGYDRSILTEVIRETTVALGLPAEANERGDVTVHERKVSGHALCFRRSTVLHHATLLVSANLSRLRFLLSPPDGDIEGVSVASVRMPVTNLADVRPGLSVDVVVDAFRSVLDGRFDGCFGRDRFGRDRLDVNSVATRPAPAASVPVDDGDDVDGGNAAVLAIPEQDISQLAAQRRAPAWVLDRTPRFVARTPVGAPCEVHDGHIADGPAAGRRFSWSLLADLDTSAELLYPAGDALAPAEAFGTAESAGTEPPGPAGPPSVAVSPAHAGASRTSVEDRVLCRL